VSASLALPARFPAASGSGAGASDVPTARWCKSCSACRRAYDRAEWMTLPVIESLPQATVQSHLSVPAAWTVELRKCACGARLAARSP
jgi:hypothetical protein